MVKAIHFDFIYRGKQHSYFSRGEAFSGKPFKVLDREIGEDSPFIFSERHFHADDRHQYIRFIMVTEAHGPKITTCSVGIPEIAMPFAYPGNSFYIRGMYRWSRLIIVFIAYGLALIHTAVPHQHAQRSQNQPVISHGGCIFHGSMGGLLQMVLSTDLGVGHLETFKKSVGIDTDFSQLAVSLLMILTPFFFLPVLLNLSAASCIRYIEKLKRRLLLLSSCHLRAPPVLA